MKTSEIFKAVRVRIADDDNRFICTAIAHLRNDERVTEDDALRMTALVMGRLGADKNDECYSARHWLIDNHALRLDDTEMREWRLMWLDQLIVEFEAKGD